MLFRGCLSSEPAFPLSSHMILFASPPAIPLVTAKVLSAFNKMDQEPLFLRHGPLQGRRPSPPRLLAWCISLLCRVVSGIRISSSRGFRGAASCLVIDLVGGERDPWTELCGARVRGEWRGPELKKDVCDL